MLLISFIAHLLIFLIAPAQNVLVTNILVTNAGNEHFVRSRYAPAHYSNHVENISDFYALLRRYIGIVFILLFQRHNHSDFIALKILLIKC